MIHVPPEALPLLLQQRTQHAHLDNAEVERAVDAEIAQFVDTVGPLLPTAATPQTFIDIGCGLGFGLLGLSRIYGARNLFVGIDRDAPTEEVIYGFSERPSSYNDLKATRLVLEAGGVQPDCIRLIDIDTQPFPEVRADVVISILAWGFHFPVATYLDQVDAALKPGGSLVIDIRRGLGGEKALAADYEQVGAVPGIKHDRCIFRRR